MISQLSNLEKQQIKETLLETVNRYPDTWKDPEALEDYVSALWDAEKDRADEYGKDIPSYPEYLLEHIAIFWEIEESGELREKHNVEISHELEDILSWYESGRFDDADGNTIEFEAHNDIVYDFAWAENTNYEEEHEAGYDTPAMYWAYEEFVNGNRFEGDDFEYLFEAIEDLVQTIQVPEI